MAYITDLLCICFPTAFLLRPTDSSLYEASLANDWQVRWRLNGSKQNVRNSTESDNTSKMSSGVNVNDIVELDVGIQRQQHIFSNGNVTITHTCTPVLSANFPDEPWLAVCPLDSPSPLIPKLCILLGQA